jgi:hypothetical protein
MKKIAKYGLTAAMAALFLVGCSEEKTIVQPAEDYQPPATPRGVTSITGDECVEILWYESDESDLAGYRVYRSLTLTGVYDLQATVQTGYYLDDRVSNGTTYYYAVASFDYDGNESDLSPENVFDTPRPAGTDLVLYDPEYRSDLAGYDFSEYRRVSYDSPSADITVDFDDELNVFFADVGNVDTDIQDFGYTESLDDVDWAPEDGWSGVGWAELIEGHSYIIWTADNRFAKFRVVDINGNSVLLDWAYQPQIGNPELAPPLRGTESLRSNARTAVLAKTAGQ